jgi:hypothetical protein
VFVKEEDGKGFWGIEDYNDMSWDRMAPRSPSILWDRDFEAEPTFGDADPLTGEDVKDNMGIDNDYFQAVAPDPSDEELESIRRRLKLLRS